MIKKESALVLFSGGQDSTTCLFWALKHFASVRTLCITYGQRHSQEVDVARTIAEKHNIPFQVLDASMIGQLAPSSLTSNIEMDKEKGNNEFPNTFVPGRNLLFLTFAATIAYAHNIRHIVTGVSEADFSGYPDCRQNFILSANSSINLAMDKNFEIHTPLMWRDKSEVWQLSDELGVFDLVRDETLTCYNGVIANGCGECPACTLRNEGLKKYIESKK